MPNWCTSEIEYISDDEKSLNELEEKIKEWTRKDEGLYNIVEKSGIGQYREEKGFYDKKGNQIYCRGWLSSITLEENHLVICVEEAWSPHLRMWDLINKKYLHGVEMLYHATEEGCGLYYTNDSSYSNKYIVDIMGNENEMKSYGFRNSNMVDKDSLIDSLQKLLNVNTTDIDELIELLEESEYIDDIYINKWEYDESLDGAM